MPSNPNTNHPQYHAHDHQVINAPLQEHWVLSLYEFMLSLSFSFFFLLSKGGDRNDNITGTKRVHISFTGVLRVQELQVSFVICSAVFLGIFGGLKFVDNKHCDWRKMTAYEWIAVLLAYFAMEIHLFLYLGVFVQLKTRTQQFLNDVELCADILERRKTGVYLQLSNPYNLLGWQEMRHYLVRKSQLVFGSVELPAAYVLLVCIISICFLMLSFYVSILRPFRHHQSLVYQDQTLWFWLIVAGFSCYHVLSYLYIGSKFKSAIDDMTERMSRQYEALQTYELMRGTQTEPMESYLQHDVTSLDLHRQLMKKLRAIESRIGLWSGLLKDKSKDTPLDNTAREERKDSANTHVDVKQGHNIAPLLLPKHRKKTLADPNSDQSKRHIVHYLARYNSRYHYLVLLKNAIDHMNTDVMMPRLFGVKISDAWWSTGVSLVISVGSTIFFLFFSGN
ncbi:hypothetical protein RFI_23928 [Reticulomyxa filosa]|uniref:Uncharacterized protein n=1 Tax=Reticulomyxa filosa TaxID=46433 RepID=X6MJ47_RETFI|nr:hypothetical protein RFI_23928 [Reticulomyxa filosa]|eukprot:ETO13447.1 hypothetical protein RFI_23928 [Reticulomyxa filosa]